MRRIFFRIIATSIMLSATACSTNPESRPSGIENPADKKCIADGFTLLPRIENGIPIGSDCADLKTGKKCDSWAYFRGECTLGG
jgi:putative hemolysin